MRKHNLFHFVRNRGISIDPNAQKKTFLSSYRNVEIHNDVNAQTFFHFILNYGRYPMLFEKNQHLTRNILDDDGLMTPYVLLSLDVVKCPQVSFYFRYFLFQQFDITIMINPSCERFLNSYVIKARRFRILSKRLSS